MVLVFIYFLKMITELSKQLDFNLVSPKPRSDYAAPLQISMLI